MSDFCLMRRIYLHLLGTRHPHGKPSFKTLDDARKAYLLKNHPDKNSQLTEEDRIIRENNLKDFNASWDAASNRGLFDPVVEESDPEEGPSTSQPPPSQKTPEYNPPAWPHELVRYFRNPPTSGLVSVFIIHVPFVRVRALFEKWTGMAHLDFVCGELKGDKGEGLICILFTYKHKLGGFERQLKSEVRGTWVQCAASTAGKWRDLKVAAVSILTRETCKSGAEPGGGESSDGVFNQSLLNAYAMEERITDAALLHAIYLLEIGKYPTDCKLCSCLPPGAPHIRLHAAHFENADLFSGVRTQRNAAQLACDCVTAMMRLENARITNEEFFKARLTHYLQVFEDSLTRETVSAAVLLFGMLPHGWTPVKFAELVYDRLVIATPKRRGIIFSGPYDCGKTTVAAAILDFLGGVHLNVNCTADRLGFELGQAIDRRVVLFDDVLGPPNKEKRLLGGQGMRNLDGLRDHLDGAVPVGLERKHQNKVQAVFPPWVLTCNEYKIPESILKRGEVLEFSPHLPNLPRYMERYNTPLRLISTGASFAGALALFCPSDNFDEDLRRQIHRIQDMCSAFGFTSMESFLYSPVPSPSQTEEEAPEEPEIPDLYAYEEIPDSPPAKKTRSE